MGLVVVVVVVVAVVVAVAVVVVMVVVVVVAVEVVCSFCSAFSRAFNFSFRREPGPLAFLEAGLVTFEGVGLVAVSLPFLGDVASELYLAMLM